MTASKINIDPSKLSDEALLSFQLAIIDEIDNCKRLLSSLQDKEHEIVMERLKRVKIEQ